MIVMKFLFFAGILFFIGSILLIESNYKMLNIERNGYLVKMRIEDLPKSCIGARVRYFITLSYRGKKYDKATRGDFCDKHHIGELIDMKMIEDSSDILFPNESVLKSLVSFGILGIFGFILAITQWKKMQNEK